MNASNSDPRWLNSLVPILHKPVPKGCSGEIDLLLTLRKFATLAQYVGIASYASLSSNHGRRLQVAGAATCRWPSRALYRKLNSQLIGKTEFAIGYVDSLLASTGRRCWSRHEASPMMIIILTALITIISTFSHQKPET